MCPFFPYRAIHNDLWKNDAPNLLSWGGTSRQDPTVSAQGFPRSADGVRALDETVVVPREFVLGWLSIVLRPVRRGHVVFPIRKEKVWKGCPAQESRYCFSKTPVGDGASGITAGLVDHDVEGAKNG